MPSQLEGYVISVVAARDQSGEPVNSRRWSGPWESPEFASGLIADLREAYPGRDWSLARWTRITGDGRETIAVERIT